MPEQPFNAKATGALFRALSTGQTAAALEALSQGADPNALEGAARNSPLMLAALYHQPLVAKALLEKGADPDYRRPGRGDTALMMAAFSNDKETAVLIIAAGANILIQNSAHRDAWMCALDEGNKEMAALILATKEARDGKNWREEFIASFRENAAALAAPRKQVSLPKPRGPVYG